MTQDNSYIWERIMFAWGEKHLALLYAFIMWTHYFGCFMYLMKDNPVVKLWLFQWAMWLDWN